MPKPTVQKAVNEGFTALLEKPKLLDIPAEYKVPADMHLVIVTCAFDADILQSILGIDSPLRGCGVMVPFTSTGKSQTPYILPLISYLSSTSKSTNKYLAGLVPAVMNTKLNGMPTLVGAMLPVDAAYQSNGMDSTGKQLYSSSAKWALLPNELSGPGLYPTAVNMFFSSSSSALPYSLTQMRKMVNQPYVLGAPVQRSAKFRYTHLSAEYVLHEK